MARSDHWVGLTPEGDALVADASASAYASHSGAYYNETPLMEYTLPDGRTLREVVQADVWHGGPHWFFCLEDADTGEMIATWSEQAMADRLGLQVGDAEPALTEADRRFFADFADDIRSGRVRLPWSDQQKFQRWDADREDAPVSPPR